jgi:hypothetical protein
MGVLPACAPTWRVPRSHLRPSPRLTLAPACRPQSLTKKKGRHYLIIVNLGGEQHARQLGITSLSVEPVTLHTFGADSAFSTAVIVEGCTPGVRATRVCLNGVPPPGHAPTLDKGDPAPEAYWENEYSVLVCRGGCKIACFWGEDCVFIHADFAPEARCP